jgi:hypothetical protein
LRPLALVAAIFVALRIPLQQVQLVTDGDREGLKLGLARAGQHVDGARGVVVQDGAYDMFVLVEDEDLVLIAAEHREVRPVGGVATEGRDGRRQSSGEIGFYEHCFRYTF